MNNLFSSSWQKDPPSPPGNIPLSLTTSSTISPDSAAGAGANLDKFFNEVESIREELNEIEKSHRKLHDSNESLKILHSPAAVRDLRGRMDGEVSAVLKRAKLVKLKLESLDRSNAASLTVQGCGPGSSSDRTRSSVVAGLRKKMKDQMEAFGDLRRRVAGDHREVVARRYYAATGEKADEATVDAMSAAEGEAESILRAAVEGRGAVETAVAEMRERKGAVEELEKSLLELHQVFLDMAVMVETQGQQLDDIESQVGRASSFVDHGVRQLQQARKHQKNTRKWTCIALLILIIIVLIIVLPIVLKN